VTVTVGAMLGLGGDDGRQSGDADESGLHVDCFYGSGTAASGVRIGSKVVRVLVLMY
jgi:hypothetical protein